MADFRLSPAIATACLLVLSLDCGAAAGVKELYELQERCGKLASQVFKRDWPDGGAAKEMTATYTNHYNARLNKCLYLETVIRTPRNGDLTGIFEIQTLNDINENRQYGSFVRDSGREMTSCVMLEKKCTSRQEWESLIEPLMEQ